MKWTYSPVIVNTSYAEGYNAFNFRLTPEVSVNVKHLWSLLDEVVSKIIQDGTRVLLVTPDQGNGSGILRTPGADRGGTRSHPEVE